MRKLLLKIKDKEYTLELNRETVKWLEDSGFSIVEMEKKLITSYELLWASLFRKNHKDVNPSLALKLMDTYQEEKGATMTNKVIKFAIEEYTSFMKALAGTDLEENNEEELNIMES